MLLVISLDLKASDHIVNILISQEKTYQEDNDFQNDCDMKTMQLVYEYLQKEHVKLIFELQQVLVEYHNLPFYKWITNNTLLYALKTQAHEML